MRFECYQNYEVKTYWLIPLTGYGYGREQGEEEASDAESEISKSKKKKVGTKSRLKENIAYSECRL